MGSGRWINNTQEDVTFGSNLFTPDVFTCLVSNSGQMWISKKGVQETLQVQTDRFSNTPL